MKKKSHIPYYLTTAAALVAFLGYFALFRTIPDPAGVVGDSPLAPGRQPARNTAPVAAAPQAALVEATAQEIEHAYGNAVSTAGLGMTYLDSDAGFSFMYPNGYTVQTAGASSDRVVIVASRAGQNPSAQDVMIFQLEVKPWHDPAPAITIERIHHDVPQIKVDDPQPVVIGGKIYGVAFISVSPDFQGYIRQIWFTVSGHLYQFTAPLTADSLLKSVMQTFTVE